MATGFVYVVTSLTKDYLQRAFRSVPTAWGNRIYFGPCKTPMRPRIREGDWVFGVSPKNGMARRIVFVAKIQERMTFAQAYNRFPCLRGPEGPIHVRPASGRGRFPDSSYKHIPRANHPRTWRADLANKKLDAFFICAKREEWRGCWLGKYGPKIDKTIVDFLKRCSVHGSAGKLSEKNQDATIENPIAHRGLRGFLFTGLHLETDKPQLLLELCAARLSDTTLPNVVVTPQPNVNLGGGCVPRAKEAVLVTKSTC